MTTTRAALLERQITVVAVVLPFLGFIAALWLLWGGAVTGLDLAILAVMYALVGFGVTIGFHRLFTHRSFEAKPWLRGTLAILGSMSVQGAVLHWVADHRKHHPFTDEEGDPPHPPPRARPAQGPADPQDRQPVPGLGAARPGHPVRPRLRALGRQLGR